MKKVTLTALQKSIRHWVRLRDNTRRRVHGHPRLEEPDGLSCALCQRFNAYDLEECTIITTGEKCPIFEKTGKIGCEKTPYYRASIAWNNSWGMGLEPNNRQYKAMDEEIKFLESLLPKDD